MGLSRTMVELMGEGVQVGLAERAEGRALGEVLPQQPVVFSSVPRCHGLRGLQR